MPLHENEPTNGATMKQKKERLSDWYGFSSTAPDLGRKFLASDGKSSASAQLEPMFTHIGRDASKGASNKYINAVIGPTERDKDKQKQTEEEKRGQSPATIRR